MNVAPAITFFLVSGTVACGLFSLFLYRIFKWPLRKALITTFSVLGIVTAFLFLILQYGKLRQ